MSDFYTQYKNSDLQELLDDLSCMGEWSVITEERSYCFFQRGSREVGFSFSFSEPHVSGIYADFEEIELAHTGTVSYKEAAKVIRKFWHCLNVIDPDGR